MMRWEKMGHIFNPQNHDLPLDCQEFAQSPQALVLKDRVRIYFSTRQREASGKFLSQVAFVDFDKNLKNILAISKDPVIPLGELGAFDEHGIFPFSPFNDGENITAYTCGWNRRKSVSVDTATGFATSEDDGLTFQKLGMGPVIGPSLQEPFLVGDSFVRKYNDIYHMWYIFGERWVRENENVAPDRVYKIAFALSDDGINWVPQNKKIITDRLHENECQALPTVLKIGDRYHMYFCYRDVFGFRSDKAKAYRLGYAYSKDLENWTRDDDASGMMTSESGWDSDMICYPHIFKCEGRVYLLYNGNEFGKLGFGAAVLIDG